MRQALYWPQHLLLQASAFTVAAADGIATSALQVLLQERKPSTQTRWSPGRQRFGTSWQNAIEQRLAQACARVESTSLRQ